MFGVNEEHSCGFQAEDAWGLLLQSADALTDVQPFLYDLVDVGRQVRSCVTLLDT